MPLVALISPANESDQAFSIALIEELIARYPSLPFSYIILDRGYDAEEIHHDIYELRSGKKPNAVLRKLCGTN